MPALLASCSFLIPQRLSRDSSVAFSASDSGCFSGSDALLFLRPKVSFLANGGSIQTRSMHPSFRLFRKGRLSAMRPVSHTDSLSFGGRGFQRAWNRCCLLQMGCRQTAKGPGAPVPVAFSRLPSGIPVLYCLSQVHRRAHSERHAWPPCRWSALLGVVVQQGLHRPPAQSADPVNLAPTVNAVGDA